MQNYLKTSQNNIKKHNTGANCYKCWQLTSFENGRMANFGSNPGKLFGKQLQTPEVLKNWTPLTIGGEQLS